MRLNFTANSFVFGRKNHENVPIKKTSEICLNFTANSFVFGRVNRKNAPGNIFVNLASGALPKCVSFTAKFFVFRRINRENAP